MKIAGKSALVTGGAQGIGRAITIALLEKDAVVVIFDIDEAMGIKTRDELNEKYGPERVTFMKCNVADEQDFEQTFLKACQYVGGLDIVCNNAGIGGDREYLSVDGLNSSWTKVIDINLKAVVHGTRLSVIRMIKQGRGGCIINTASMGGLLPQPESPVYSATKHGVVGLSRSLGYLKESHNIRVNAICPSFVNTRLVRDSERHNEAETQEIFAKVGIIQPDLIAEGVVRLVEDDKISGEVMRGTSQNGLDFQKYRPSQRRPDADAAAVKRILENYPKPPPPPKKRTSKL